MTTLNDLFRDADILEVMEDDGGVSLSFWLRETRDQHDAFGPTLDDAVEVASDIVMRDLTLSDLQERGLSDADLDRLSANRFIDAEVEAAWDRGFEAGVMDTVTSERAALDAIRTIHAERPITNEPATTAVAEPFGTVDTQAVLNAHPLITVVYAPVAIVQDHK